MDDNPNALMLLRAGGQLFCALIINISIFGPKLYYIINGRANDKDMTAFENDVR